jgi:quinol monooxygenase YgiN
MGHENQMLQGGQMLQDGQMLIVAGEFVMDPDRREEFLRDRAAGMATSRAEDGCLDYVLSADPMVPGRVVLFERWESAEALDAHLVALRAQPATGPGVPVSSREVLRYEIASVGPLGG